MKRWNCLRGVLALLIFLSAFPLSAGAQRMTVMDKKCQQESEKGSVRCLEWRAINILARSGRDKDKIKKAINILNQARAKDPLDLGILSNIATCYIQMRDYNDALCYVDTTLDVKQQKRGFYEPSLLKCMLQERLDFPRPQCSACYRAVVTWHRKAGETDTVEYVYAVLMAETPNCEQIKNKFLEGLEPGSGIAKMWNELLRNFDREKFLHEMLP